jgi:uncharacterized protein (DUF2147 family)
LLFVESIIFYPYLISLNGAKGKRSKKGMQKKKDNRRKWKWKGGEEKEERDKHIHTKKRDRLTTGKENKGRNIYLHSNFSEKTALTTA